MTGNTRTRRAGDGPMEPDQVVRLEEFRKAHPAVDIAFGQLTQEWRASWDGGKLSGIRELKVLLDTLERIPEVTRLRQGE